jgi:TPR repeat protein
MSAARAVQVCDAAVREDPQNGRFHYQLGKALEQSGRLEEAVDAYTDAASLGHLRADNALGQIAARQPGQEQAGMTYFRRCADQGDPICVQSLGILQLKLADTSAEYDEAYQLLSYAIDFGLPEAMRALADHFDNPATPDHDPERAAVFSREAAAREAEIGRVRPQRETSAWITDLINRRNDPGGAEKGNDNDDSDDNDDNSNF